MKIHALTRKVDRLVVVVKERGGHQGGGGQVAGCSEEHGGRSRG